MTQIDKANQFAKLHTLGNPVVLYNIWDAGSAKVVADNGALAIATGSWSVAEAQGYGDGEKIPLETLLQIISRIVASNNLPLTVDFEGGYAKEPSEITGNVGRLIETGAIGINFEDQIVGGSGIYAIDTQAKRIEGARAAGTQSGVPIFINARTDLFLKEPDQTKHASLVAEAKSRAAAYKAAGASGFFIPGLTDSALIEDICNTVDLPINVMMKSELGTIKDVAKLGAARISYGPAPYAEAMAKLGERFSSLA